MHNSKLHFFRVPMHFLCFHSELMKTDVRQKFALKLEKIWENFVFTHQNEIGYFCPGKKLQTVEFPFFRFGWKPRENTTQNRWRNSSNLFLLLQIISWMDLKQDSQICENPYKFACGNFINHYKEHELYLNNRGEWDEKAHLEYEGKFSHHLW